MKIKTKILGTLLGMALLVALMGAFAVNRQNAAAMLGVTKEAQDVADLVSFLLMSDANKLSAASVQEIVARLHQTQGRDVVLMDPDQLILADAIPAEIGTIFTHDPNDEIGATIKDRQIRTFVEVSEAYPAGIKQIVVPVEGEAGRVLGAVVLEYTPLYDELRRLGTGTAHQVIAAGCGGGLIALLLALYMGRSIAGPLQQLRNAAIGFAAGRTDLPMPAPRHDEVGELAAAFSDMMARRQRAKDELGRLRDDLEERVIQRTAELEEANEALRAENTERKRAEQASERTLQRLHDAQRIAQIGDWEWDIATQAITWSPQVFEIIGRDPSLGPPRDYEDYAAIYDTANGAILQENVARAIESGEAQKYELVMLQVDGERVDVQAMAVPRKDKSGRVVGLYGTIQDITARKRSEEALRVSEERLRAALSASGTGTFRWDLRTNEVSWDVSLDALFGLLPGRTVRSLEAFIAVVYPDDRAGVMERCERCAMKGADFAMEFRVLWPDGSVHWLDDKGKTFFDDAGQPLYMTGACVDITERKRAEEALRTSVAEFRTLSEAMPQMVWITRPDGWNVYFSKQWMDYTGLTLEESLGHGWNQPFHPDDQQRAWVAWQHATATTGTYSIECRLRRADGVYRWWLIRGVPQQDAAGQILKWFGTCTDIHDLKQAELEISRTNQELRESQRFAESLAENSTSIIYLYEPDTGRSVYSNRNVAEFLGYSQAQILEFGENILPAIMHLEDLPRIAQHHARFAEVADNRVIDLEFRLKHASGDWHWIWARETVFKRRPNGAAWQIMGTAQDITERRRTEEELHAAKEAAEAANRAKSEFLANMSHEIRTPMNGIIGMTDLVLDSELDRRQREYLGMAKSSAHALLGLINQILDFSKIEAGKLELEKIDFSLRETIEHLLKPLVLRGRQQGLELRTEIADDVAEHLVGDPLRLRQILVNLTDNALKFTPRGSIVVRVAAEGQREGERGLRFSIADTGIGIPPEKQGLIFEAFAQVDGSTTRNYGGTGLGLAIASQLVRQMRGKLWIESTLGAGTTFHFTAWFGVAAASSSALRSAEAGGVRTRDAHEGKGLRILLAEDNVINRAVAVGILQKRGHSLVHATNGREAVEAAAREAFDMIFMDVQMPEMDGFAATRLIRDSEQGTGRHTPIAAMTAHALAGDRERCLAAGMDDYISKPLQKAGLLALLARVAATRHADAGVHRAVDALGRMGRIGPMSPTGALPVFSRQKLLDQVDGDEPLLGRMIALFHENTPRLLDDIRGSITRRDSGDLARSAHALLSSLGAFGADGAHQLTQELETQARGANLENTARTFAALERETAEIHAALAAFAPAPASLG
ncbi:MAG: hypothetical protein QOE70_429 [Chthoniobacter sp.]|jgi:PAS domain S-box-containing protein|nr:hypothetical protein [Chthoniobacter sp.]